MSDRRTNRTLEELSADPGTQRAAAALVAALHRKAARFTPKPLIVPEAKRSAHRGWVLAAAACAALIVGGLALIPGLLGRGGQEGTIGDPTAERTSTESVNTQSGLPDPQPGWRWESYLNVAVQVPEEWGDDYARGPDWCAEGADAALRTPYVALPAGATLSIGCPEEGPANPLNPQVPRRLNETHVTFVTGEVTQRPVTHADDGDWHLRAKQMTGLVKVSVLADDAHLDVAEQIVASARVVFVDARGCPTAASVIDVPEKTPAPPAGTRLDQWRDVDQVRICQYYRGLELTDFASSDTPAGGTPAPMGDLPELKGSRLVTGDEAAALVAALQAAPEGSGPNSPGTCAKGFNGDDALTMDFFSGDRQVGTAYVYYSGCRGNGIYDGTTVREITDACRTWFGGRVVLTSTSGNLGERCFAR